MLPPNRTARPVPRPLGQRTTSAPAPNVTTNVPGLYSPPATSSTPTVNVAPPSGAGGAAPSSTPPARPAQPAQTTPPVIPPSPAATCCPQVSTFAKPATRTVYFGFDDNTNQVVNTNADEYWIPPTAPKSLPANKEDPDGSNWVSVAVGRETEIVIAFAGQSGLACIGNCTFVVDAPMVAEVTTTTVVGNNSAFKIKGKAAGECSVEVKCNGNTLGWIHVWCAAAVTIDVEVASIVTPNSRAAAYVVADLESYINAVYADLFITVSLIDKGAVAVVPPAAGYLTSVADYLALDTLTQAAAATPFTAPYRLLYYVNTGAFSGIYGIVPGGVGTGKAGYAFFDHDIQGSYNTMAHELGHSLNLSHPLHDDDGDEFPVRHLAGLGGTNVMPLDPWNLMGYNGTLPQRGPNRRDLRYRQWKKCRRA